MVRWLLAGVLLAASIVEAGPVSILSAEARITFLGPTAGDLPNTRTQTVSLGDSELFNYDGAGPGDSRGNGLVFYSFQPFKDAFQLFVQTKHQTHEEPSGAGGNASFSLLFTTSVPLRYTFESSVTKPPAFFSANFPGVDASAQFAGDNTWTGTIPQTTNEQGEVEFGLFIREGVFPAGSTISLAVDSITYGSSLGQPNESEGFLKFNVEPVMIPLPSLVVPAVVCLALGGIVARRLKA